MDSLPFFWPPLWDGCATGFTLNRMHLAVGYVMLLQNPKLQGHICLIILCLLPLQVYVSVSIETALMSMYR